MGDAVQPCPSSSLPYDVVAHSAGGWSTSVLLRAVRRGVIHAPRRVLFMEVPCTVPMFARIYMQGQGGGAQHLPAPYSLDGAKFPWLWRALGYLVFQFMAKDLWNIHLMYTSFS